MNARKTSSAKKPKAQPLDTTSTAQQFKKKQIKQTNQRRNNELLARNQPNNQTNKSKEFRQT